MVSWLCSSHCKSVTRGICWNFATDFCSTEEFSARCKNGHVILITSGRYGRMRIGRCVRVDFGFVGCYADVVDVLDRHCSGRQQCQLRIPDPEMDERRPCLSDLTRYLEASYRCIPGQPAHPSPSQFSFSHFVGDPYTYRCSCSISLQTNSPSMNAKPHSSYIIAFFIAATYLDGRHCFWLLPPPERYNVLPISVSVFPSLCLSGSNLMCLGWRMHQLCFDSPLLQDC